MTSSITKDQKLLIHMYYAINAMLADDMATRAIVDTDTDTVCREYSCQY